MVTGWNKKSRDSGVLQKFCETLLQNVNAAGEVSLTTFQICEMEAQFEISQRHSKNEDHPFQLLDIEASELRIAELIQGCLADRGRKLKPGGLFDTCKAEKQPGGSSNKAEKPAGSEKIRADNLKRNKEFWQSLAMDIHADDSHAKKRRTVRDCRDRSLWFSFFSETKWLTSVSI